MKNSKLLVTVVSLVLVLAMLGGVCIFVSADSSAVNLNVVATKDVQISVNGSLKYTGTTTRLSVEKGATVKVEASGDGFLYWTDGANNTVTGSKSYTFKIRSNTELTANFEATEGCWVVYRNTNDTKQILAKATYTSAANFTEDLAASATNIGCVFTGWNKTVKEVQDAITAGAKYIEVNPVYNEAAASCTINAVNGTVNGGASATVNVLDEVTLTANVSGPVYWVDSTGNVISDNATVKVTVIGNETYTAKSGTAEAAASVAFNTNGSTVDVTAKYFVPSGNVIKEHGLIYTKVATNKDLTLDTVDGALVKKVSFTKYSGMILATFVNCTSHLYVRAYVVYSDGNSETIVYSPVKLELIDKSFSNDNNSKYEDTYEDSFDENWDSSFLRYADSYRTVNNAILYSYAGKSLADYTGLCAKYKTNGYTEYSTFDSGAGDKVLATTFVRGSELAHIYYSSNEKEVNIVKSTSEGAALPDVVNSISGSKTINVTQLQATDAYNGMGYIITLPDGSFIVYDGGYDTGVAELRELLPSGAHIRAWLITHGDADHYTGFVEYMKQYKTTVTLDTLMIAPISGVTTGSYTTIKNAVSGTKTEICYVHTGMSFKYGDVKMNILFSPEELWIDGTATSGTATNGEKVSNNNTSSIISRIEKTNGKSMIFLGDASHFTSDKLETLYGTDLKSDMCQVSHHGCESFTVTAYQKINASIYFIPSCVHLYQGGSCNHSSAIGAYTGSPNTSRNADVITYLKSTGATIKYRSARYTENF